MNVYCLSDDVYALPINELIRKQLSTDYYILYAPKAGISSVVNKDFLKKVSNGDREALVQMEPFNTTRLWDELSPAQDSSQAASILYILPNYKCNLSCSYCYAAKGRSHAEINKSQALAAVEAFLNSRKTPAEGTLKPLRITFMGGGEPLLSWDIVKNVIDKAHQITTGTGRKIIFSIITNGTILSKQILQTFQNYDIRVNISFDITPEFQQLQRGQHARVSRHIDRLLDSGIKLLIRSTITPQSAPHLPEIAQYAINRFPKLKRIAFEPVTDETLTPEQLRSFLSVFRDNFFQAKSYLGERDIQLITSDIISARTPARKHCPSSISLNPEQTLTACPCFSSPKETGYQQNTVGHIRNGALSVDEKQYANAMPNCNSLPPECRSCYARWHCAGGCVHQRIVYSPEQMREVCNHTRLMLRRVLLDKIDGQMQQSNHPPLSCLLK